MSIWGQLSFQDPASPLMAQLVGFHDHAIILLTLVTTLVSYALLSLWPNTLSRRSLLEAQQVETIWTLVPALTLLFLALPSLRLLYLMDEVASPSLTLKALGHQWYWTYEYSDFPNLEFDSYMLPSSSLFPGDPRLLEVDNRAVLPLATDIRVLVTSSDVIHAWTLPRLGLKIDAIPGRLNQLGLTLTRPGVYYGQCSEICGANHSFMPIAIEALPAPPFLLWASQRSAP